ncbi:response regulator [Ureibacillus sp. GCM10028918]|uniref:response regulator n=1 Tax=Ureibacillus sp. GCM10028918 TaxID=3273429 RepID=UPI003606AAA3
MIKAILIDDEHLALTTLQKKLAEFSNIQVVHSYLGTEFKLHDLHHLDVDVIFLDMEMGELTGLDLADSIQLTFPNIHIVFVTAHAEYAVQAFEVNSLDYLLKPVTSARLKKTLSRLMKVIEQTKGYAAIHLKNTETPFAIKCFKEFQCIHNNLPIAFKTTKTKELFAYFVIHQDIPIHRDVLIEALWPDHDYKKSKINLHTCLSHLRKLLNNYGYSDRISLVNHSYIFSLNTMSCDVHQFQQLLKSIEKIDESTIQFVHECIELYKGPLFELNHYDWANSIAARISSAYLQVLEKTVQYFAAIDNSKMLYYLQLQLPLFPYDDEKVAKCMSLLTEKGYRNEAVKLYIDFKNRLEKDLNVAPSSELDELYHRIVFV